MRCGQQKKKQQTIGRGELIELILSRNARGWVEEEEEGEEVGRVSWNCRNSFQAENGQIFGYKRLKQFQFLIHLHILVAQWAQFIRHMLSVLGVCCLAHEPPPTPSPSRTPHTHPPSIKQ